MKSASFFVVGGVLLCACVFDGGSERPNPFIGQWQDRDGEWAYKVEDSLYREGLEDYLRDHGVTFTGDIPDSFPPALVDSFQASFSCDSPACDSVLWIQRSYLVFEADSVFSLDLRNGVWVGRADYAYRFDADSVYQRNAITEEFFGGEIGLAYAFSADGDTLTFDGGGPGNIFVKSEDSLPDY